MIREKNTSGFRPWLLLMLGMTMVLPAHGVGKADKNADHYRALIQQLREAPRGPFSRIRWFCADGTRKAPKPGSCAKHGGGIQHGEWNRDTRKLRKNGFLVANVLGDYANPKAKPLRSMTPEKLKHILLERFFIGRDDGWLFHKARFYRGALQIEDEQVGAEQLKSWMLKKMDVGNQEFLLLREANRLLPQVMSRASADKMRNMATRIAAKDRRFEPLRVKLHGIPQEQDAVSVRAYANSKGKPGLRDDYLELADEVERLFSPDLSASSQDWLKELKNVGTVGEIFWHYQELEDTGDSEKRLALSSELLAALRKSMPQEKTSTQQLLLDSGVAIETQLFAASSELVHFLPEASRSQRLYWLDKTTAGLYGLGLISKREWQSVSATINRLQTQPITAQQYRIELQSLSRLPGWSNRWMNFHFAKVVEKFSAIEPLAVQFLPARLRSSPLQFYTEVLDSLLQDANVLVGVENKVFDQFVDSGVRPLNAGIARGELKVAQSDEALDPKGIYLLPHTTAELTPVAGILTRGEGNALSHVQLLAANLGIPNIVVDDKLAADLTAKQGMTVMLAVSPGGTVHLVEDEPANAELFESRNAPPEVEIIPNMEKLDLNTRTLKTLSELRSHDSGKIVGPKAANLAELKHFFPRAVVDGVVVPFGVFDELLDQPMRGNGESIRKWMLRQYQSLQKMDGEMRAVTTDILLRELRYKLEHIEISPAFEKSLRIKLKQVFGENGSYAVFVRSDTNIEDLPGFTGAGLNLTVPNVVGVDNIIKAIKSVWASPFTERAFAWRQGRMKTPEHVYPSVLLMKTVPVEKSGVMLTLDTQTGATDVLSIAVNRGIGGAVQGQSAEELRIIRNTGEIRLMAESTSPVIKVINKLGGLKKMAAPAEGAVVTDDETLQLLSLGRQIEKLIPQRDEQGKLTPADIEFGFENGQLRLFQIRPYLRNKRAYQHQFLLSLDKGLHQGNDGLVDMTQIPHVR